MRQRSAAFPRASAASLPKTDAFAGGAAGAGAGIGLTRGKAEFTPAADFLPANLVSAPASRLLMLSFCRTPLSLYVGVSTWV